MAVNRNRNRNNTVDLILVILLVLHILFLPLRLFVVVIVTVVILDIFRSIDCWPLRCCYYFCWIIQNKTKSLLGLCSRYCTAITAVLLLCTRGVDHYYHSLRDRNCWERWIHRFSSSIIKHTTDFFWILRARDWMSLIDSIRSLAARRSTLMHMHWMDSTCKQNEK